MKANNLKPGAASSFQGHSRNIPDCAFNHVMVMSRRTALRCSRTTSPRWGPNRCSWSWWLTPPNSRWGGPAGSVRNRMRSHHQVRPCPLRAVPSPGHSTWTQNPACCGQPQARETRPEALPGTRTHKLTMLCPPI